MNKKKTILFLMISLFIFTFHIILIALNILKGTLTTAFVIDGILAFFVLVSMRILYTHDKNEDTLAQRYLIVTTLQFIGFLSGVLGMVYGRIPDVKYWTFSALIIFLLILFTQTIFLLQSITSNSSKETKKESN
jgi:hypothetical protein